MKRYCNSYYNDATVERVLMLTRYFIKEMCTIKDVCEWSGYSNWVVYDDLVVKLPKIDLDAAEEVRIIIDLNKEERAHRGGTKAAEKRRTNAVAKKKDTV